MADLSLGRLPEQKPPSPAGIAIAAACEGETVSYRVPDGTGITVKLVAVGENAFAAA